MNFDAFGIMKREFLFLGKFRKNLQNFYFVELFLNNF